MNKKITRISLFALTTVCLISSSTVWANESNNVNNNSAINNNVMTKRAPKAPMVGNMRNNNPTNPSYNRNYNNKPNNRTRNRRGNRKKHHKNNQMFNNSQRFKNHKSRFSNQNQGFKNQPNNFSQSNSKAILKKCKKSSHINESVRKVIRKSKNHPFKLTVQQQNFMSCITH